MDAGTLWERVDQVSTRLATLQGVVDAPEVIDMESETGKQRINECLCVVE